jgi:hypothetical protein
MIAPLTQQQQSSIRSLMADPEKRFDDVLQWLADSREATHQQMYTRLDPQFVAYMQGEAKTLFDVVNQCHQAFERRGEPAIPHLPETPGGG